MMRRFPLVLNIALASLTLGAWVCSIRTVTATDTPSSRGPIPYVATRNDAVRDMLWMAEVGKDDVVHDLGSGDGRIVIAAVSDFGARRAIGVEIDPVRVQESRVNAQKAGVADRVEFIQSDLFTHDLRQATVVTLFLGHQPNLDLRPKLIHLLQPGTRIVSHQFGMGEWQTDKSLKVRNVYFGMWGERWNPYRDNPRVPDYTGNEMHYGSSDNILMWIVPAPVAGVWRGKVASSAGEQDLTVVLHQRLSDVSGTFRLSSGQTDKTGNVRADLWGDHLRFSCSLGAGYRVQFDGHIHENTLRGTLAVPDGGQWRQSEWQARRDPVDVSGLWEWPCLSGSRTVALRIEHRDDTYSATYVDHNRPAQVKDFYDHGGGFYFTLLIGPEGDGLRIKEDMGWLLGEAIVDDGILKGTIEFHPDRDMSDRREGREAKRPVTRSWTPRRGQPSVLPEADQHVPSSTPAPAAGSTETDNGKVVKDLQTRLSANKESFPAGQPVLIKLEVTNVGDKVRHYAEHLRMINNGLTVTDQRGQAVPYVGGTAQTPTTLVKIEPGQSRILEEFNLAAGYYLRRPGRYTVSFPGAPGSNFPRPVGGEDCEAPDYGVPPSNKLSFEITPNPAATADGDPVGRLLPLIRDDWSLVGAPDASGKVRPGANRQEVPGRQIIFQSNPTGVIRDIALVWLWLTDDPADEIEKAAAHGPPWSEYLGRISQWHVYVHAPPEATKRWPKAKEDIQRALQKTFVKAEDYDYYCRLHDRYKALILRAAREADEDELSKQTDRFNASIGGRLLYVRVVRRSGPIDHHKTVLSKFFGDRKLITLEKIHYAYSAGLHVSRRSNGKNYVLIETNEVATRKWPDDIQITLAVEPAPLATNPDAVRMPEILTMTLAWIADAGEPKQAVFVINGVVAYKTVKGLKDYLKDIPRGSTLTWSPECRRLGNAPLLGSKDEMEKFKDFCKSSGIHFVLVPSG